MIKLKIPKYLIWIGVTAFIFLLLMTLLRMVLVFTMQVPSNEKEGILAAYLLGVRFDLRIVSIAALVIFLIGSLPFLHPYRTKAGRQVSFVLWGIFCLLLCLFYAVDFANFAYLSQRMQASLLNFFGDASTSMHMVWQSYHVIWWFIALLIVLFLLLLLVSVIYRWVGKLQEVRQVSFRWGWSVLFFLLLGLGIFGKINQYPLRWSDAYSLKNDYQANIALNPFQSFFSSMSFMNSSYDLHKVKKAYSWIADLLGVNHPDSTHLNYVRSYPSTSLQRPNVIFVICESFSMYKSSMSGNPLNTTPYFQGLCNQGVFFDHCFTPSYGTARGVWASITGIPDVELNNTSSRNPSAVDQHSVMNDFKGYDKYYFIGGSTSWANIRGVLTNNLKGVHIYEQQDYKAKPIDVWGVSDKNLFLESTHILGSNETASHKPFIAVIQTADNHRPYTIPQEDQAAFHPIHQPLNVLLKYGFQSEAEYNAFRYTDFCYEQFMKAASQQPYYRNTIFVFVGDHGIRGDASHILPLGYTQSGLTNMHVPLLFYAPSLIKPQTYHFVCSQIDILPTIAGLCGIPYRNTTLGQNLLSPASLQAKDHYAFAFDPMNKIMGVVDDRFYYGYQFMGGDKSQLLRMDGNAPVSDQDRLYYSGLLRPIVDAFFETSRYMLLNNKK